MHYVIHIFSCLILSLFSISSHAEIYKWVDEKGRVHFSETAPENQQAENLSKDIQESGNFMDYPELPAVKTFTKPATQRTAITVNIELIEYELSDSARKSIHANIKAIYRAYQQWFGWPAQPQHPITIKIFGRIDAFESYQKQTTGQVIFRDHYSHAKREIVMKGTAFEEGTLNTLFHEASHAIMHMQLSNTSKWLNEGLAEVFADTLSVRGGLPNLGTDQQWLAISKLMIKEDSLNTANEYLSMPNSAWTSEGKRVERSHYMIAWTLMRFLTSSKQGRDTLKNVLTLSKRQSLNGKSLAKHMGDNYPGGIHALDKNWKKWLKSK